MSNYPKIVCHTCKRAHCLPDKFNRDVEAADVVAKAIPAILEALRVLPEGFEVCYNRFGRAETLDLSRYWLELHEGHDLAGAGEWAFDYEEGPYRAPANSAADT